MSVIGHQRCVETRSAIARRACAMQVIHEGLGTTPQVMDCIWVVRGEEPKTRINAKRAEANGGRGQLGG